MYLETPHESTLTIKALGVACSKVHPVDRNTLSWDVLARFGVPDIMVEVIRHLFPPRHGRMREVGYDGECSDWFVVE